MWHPVNDSTKTDNDANHKYVKDHETSCVHANDTAHDGVQVSTTSRHHSIVDVLANSSQQEDSILRDSGTASVQKFIAVENMVDGSDHSDSDNDGAQEYFEMEDTGTADTQNVDDGNSVGDGSGGDDSNSDGAQNNGAEVTGVDNDPPQCEDEKCVAVPTCLADSSDHRKVVSHIFGRNKSCTRDLPDNLWIYWCRKHYQRLKYRAEDSASWHTRQLGLVRTQLQTFEVWGQVRSWNIELRKAEKDAITYENKKGAKHPNSTFPCWERFLVPYLGINKTYTQVRQVLDLIEQEFNHPEFQKRDKKLKTFPGVEFLPNVLKAKVVKKPAAKKGEAGYKKITLDQPAFKRKTRVNNEIIKDMAAKKRKTPTMDDAATNGTITKDTVNKTPRLTPPSNKRRRLTRGFSKHSSDSDESPSKEKEVEA